MWHWRLEYANDAENSALPSQEYIIKSENGHLKVQ